MTRRYLALMIAPVSPSNGRTVEHNIGVAKDWYPFLREITADLPITIVCPWLVGILLGDQDGDPAQRERALVDSETGAARCDFTIAVGQIVTPSTGMRREIAGCPGPWVDLLDLGMEYETPQRMGRDRREEIRERLRNVLEEIAASEEQRQAVDRETQRSISDWATATFGATSSNARVASRSNQEMAELLRWLTIDDNHAEARLETADVVIVLYRLAQRMGFDLHEAIDEKMAINRKREWVMTGDGHGQHVRHVRKDKQP